MAAFPPHHHRLLSPCIKAEAPRVPMTPANHVTGEGAECNALAGTSATRTIVPGSALQRHAIAQTSNRRRISSTSSPASAWSARPWARQTPRCESTRPTMLVVAGPGVFGANHGVRMLESVGQTMDPGYGTLVETDLLLR